MPLFASPKGKSDGGYSVSDFRCFFYENWDEPNIFEQTVPQVFPTTAQGSFTYLPDCGKIMLTSFYPFQWDLNYHNPMIFNFSEQPQRIALHEGWYTDLLAN